MIKSIHSLSTVNNDFIEGPSFEWRSAEGTPRPGTVVVDPQKTHQSILGLGGIWTDTDLHGLLRMSPEKQEEALIALFDREKGAGWSIMRCPLGSTDWETTPDFYTYDDMPRGEKDWDLSHFSVQRDIDRGYFDVLRRCKKINPDLVFFGSVWGMPAWMKENDSIMYGRFDPACTDVYARYLAKTARAFKEQGIDLYAITPQNESLCGNDRATPATRMTYWIQRDLAIAMRREFDKAGLDTRVWIYDHNFDMTDYFVKPILEDAELRKAIDGVAYHDYGGDPFAMGEMYKLHPDVNFYMTERTITTVPQMDALVRELRNGARSYAQWTTMSDEYGGPHVFLGKPFIYRTPQPESRHNLLYNLRNEPDTLLKGASYGIYGIFTKYLTPGMVRVDSTYGSADNVTTVAFRDPKDGHIALVAVNQNDEEKSFTLRCGDGEAEVTQPAMSIAAYLFTPEGITAQPCAVPAEAPAVRDCWDLTIDEIKLNGPEKAGADLLLSAIVRNVGTRPTPAGNVHVQFSEDGDNDIARSYVPMPSLQPGECFEAVSNVPFGQPYVYRVAWKAEQGRHQIFARVNLGGVEPEEWTHNNIIAREYFFE